MFLRINVFSLLLLIFFNNVDARATSGVPPSCQGHLDWAYNTGRNTNPEWYSSLEATCGVSVQAASYEDFQRLFKCKNINANDCNEKGLTYPTTCTALPCNVCAITVPKSCREHIDWAFNRGKVSNPEWYSNMGQTCGVSVQEASFEDFQRLFKCEDIASKDCNGQGLGFPSTCTTPPCNVCTVAKCCARENEDVFNPNVCQGIDHPVDCCDGLQKTFVAGPNNYVCKKQSSSDDSLGPITIQGRNILVNGKVFYMKGVNWNPVPKGRTHPPREEDFLTYARMDAPKMKEAGINIVRTYATVTSTDVLQVFVDNGIRVVNPINPLNSKSSIQQLVRSLKTHPGIFMWALGNEWNYNKCYSGISYEECANKIRQSSDAIKSVDSEHPISTIYGEIPSKDLIDSMPKIDVWGLNIYSGDTFGDRFDRWSELSNKPMYIGEYGADAWNANKDREDDASQAEATTRLVDEIKLDSTQNGGPCTGGIIFEWADEWWKAPGSPWVQDKGGIAPGGGPYPDKTFNEEYWGLVTIDRDPRPAYYAYKNA